MKIFRPAYLEVIASRLTRNPVVSLLGPRQAGKTTLAWAFADARAAEGLEVHYFDLESSADLLRLQNPELALQPLRGLVVLDEIQRKPELFPILRVLADRRDTPARFLILGSASASLIKGASESLAGRVSFVDVTGFALTELGADALQDRWWRGGFPKAYTAETDEDAREWHTDFFRTFLEQDIPQLGITVPADTLRRFWTMVAHYHGQTWNASPFSASLGVSSPAIRRYLDMLSGTYVIRQLPPWFENLKKRQVRASKVYIRDSGVLHALLNIAPRDSLMSHPMLGASWEGFALEQILSVVGERNAYFWAIHSGAELDLLVFHKGKRLGFEFKYSESPKTTKSMHSAISELKLDHLYIVHPGKYSSPFHENLTATSLADTLDILSSD